jgi:hypothetical protein
METKFEDIYLTDDCKVEKSKQPRCNRITFRLTNSPPYEWQDRLKHSGYRYHIEAQSNYIAIDFPSEQEFGQPQLDELKSHIKEVNKKYQHLLEEREKSAEAIREQAQKGEEQLELIKGGIKKLNFDK